MGLILSIFLFSCVSAVCTVTLFKEQYKPSEVIEASMNCSDVNEKLQTYVLNWSNSSGYQLELDTGTTPSSVSSPFFQTYTIPSTYAGKINANLTGTNLEGSDWANVSGTSANVLTITDAMFTPMVYIGNLFAVDFKVENNLGKAVSNAHCFIYGTDNTDSPIQICGETETRNGRGICGGVLASDFFEGNNYLAKIRCSCNINGTDDSCFDEDGVPIIASSGSGIYPLTVSSWLSVNTVVDQAVYKQKEEIVICANLSNLNYPERINTQIYHQVRCSSGIDNNDDLDRVLIISDDNNPDFRGISSNTTQMQCKRFVVPEPRYLQGKSSQCYASTVVSVLNPLNEVIQTYRTTSSLFNITLDDLQIQPDWQRQTNYQWNSIVNLSESSYNDYNASTTLSNLDLRLDKVVTAIRSYEQDILPEVEFNNMLLAKYIKSWTVYNKSGALVSAFLELNEDGNLELEVRDVDISRTGYYNITIILESFEERQTNSLEGLNESGYRGANALGGMNSTLTNSTKILNTMSNWLGSITGHLLSLVGIGNDALVYMNRSTVAFETIANKTGTFAFSIEIPSKVDSSDGFLNVDISAQVELGTAEEVEGHFICYLDNYKEETKVQWTHAVNQTSPYLERKQIIFPAGITGPQRITCKVGETSLTNLIHTASLPFEIVVGGFGRSPVGRVAGNPISWIVILVLVWLLLRNKKDKN